jgi:hypothetical protein
MTKTKKAVSDVARYAQEVAKDERLRADLSSAIGHGSRASDRLRKDIEAGGAIYARLAADTKLRKSLRAMLDDLDTASKRVQRKSSHRLRKIMLVLGGAIAAAVAVPKLRSWVRDGRLRDERLETSGDYS